MMIRERDLEVKCKDTDAGLSHSPVENRSTNDYNFFKQLGNRNKESSKPKGAVIRQLLTRELQTDRMSSNSQKINGGIAC